MNIRRVVRKKTTKATKKESESQPLPEKNGESDKEMESISIQKLKELRRSNMEEIQPRGKLEKLKMPTVIQDSAERILRKYLKVVNGIPKITDIVYAMGNAIAEKMGIKKK